MSELFGSTTIEIQAPPTPPAAPPLTQREQRALDIEAELLDLNQQIALTQQAEDEATRRALEQELGQPIPSFVAKQLAEQSKLLSGFQTEQAAALASQQAQRAAFERAVGMPLDEFLAQQALAEIETGALQRSVQRQTLEEGAAQRAAFIAATGMTPEEAAAEEAQGQLVLSRELRKRFQAATAGTLPVSPGLERSLADQRQELVDSLRQQLGPGYALSTPGITALAEFDKRAEELRESARKGAISEAEQTGFALVPATERVRVARAGALQGAGTLTNALSLGERIAGREFLGSPVVSPVSAISPFLSRSMIRTPPQAGTLQAALAAERAFQFAPQMQGFQTAANFANMLNQAQIGAAGARATAGGALLQSLIGAGGTLGAAALLRDTSGGASFLRR